MRVEERELLATVHHITGVVVIEGDALRRAGLACDPLVDEGVGEPDRIAQSRCILQARQRRLRREIRASVRQPPAGKLERGIRPQLVEVIAVLIAVSNREQARPDHVRQTMLDACGIAAVWHQSSKPIGDAETTLDLAQKHHAAIRGKPAAVECGRDFLGLNSWKSKRQDRIVGHGGCGRGGEVERIGVSNQILIHINRLCYIRQPAKPAPVN